MVGTVYNGALSHFFYKSICQGITDDDYYYQGWELMWHLLAVGFPCISALLGVAMGVMNHSSFGCWIAPHPSDCVHNDEVDCIRGEKAFLVGWFFVGIPCLIIVGIIAYCMWKIQVEVGEAARAHNEGSQLEREGGARFSQSPQRSEKSEQPKSRSESTKTKWRGGKQHQGDLDEATQSNEQGDPTMETLPQNESFQRLSATSKTSHKRASGRVSMDGSVGSYPTPQPQASTPATATAIIDEPSKSGTIQRPATHTRAAPQMDDPKTTDSTSQLLTSSSCASTSDGIVTEKRWSESADGANRATADGRSNADSVVNHAADRSVNGVQQRVAEVARQAYWYIGIYVATHMFGFLAYNLYMNGIDPPFVSIWLYIISWPLQGFANFFVFIRPRVVVLRNRFPSLSRTRAMYLALFRYDGMVDPASASSRVESETSK